MARAFWKGSLSFGLVEIPVGPLFVGLREDKPASEVVRENPAPASARAAGGVTGRKREPPARRRPPDTPTRLPPPVRDPNPKPPVADPPQKPSKRPIREPLDKAALAALGLR